MYLMAIHGLPRLYLNKPLRDENNHKIAVRQRASLRFLVRPSCTLSNGALAKLHLRW